jgi:tetratricopeptide (TPR) repeat protein
MVRLRLRNEVFVLLLALVAPSFAVCQISHNNVTISGIVMEEGSNERIEHVHIRLCDGGGNQLEETATAQSGEFAFRGLQRGHYILTLEANDYESTEMQLDMSYTSDKGMTIYLKPVVKPSSAGSGGPPVSAHELSMPEAARKLLHSGQKKLYGDKDPQGALTDFQQAVSTAPGYYEAHREIAIAYMTMGKAEEAQASLRKSIEVSGDTYGDAEIDLGTLLIEKGDVEAGEKAVRRGVELNPSSWMGFYELGKLDLGRDRLDLALKSAEQAKSLAPNRPIIYRLLANIHMRQKNYKELLADLDVYIKLDPDSPAGLRAVQMREQIAQEVAKQSQAAPSQSTPK